MLTKTLALGEPASRDHTSSGGDIGELWASRLSRGGEVGSAGYLEKVRWGPTGYLEKVRWGTTGYLEVLR